MQPTKKAATHMTDNTYDPEMVDAIVRKMSFSERTTVQFLEFLEKELNWHRPFAFTSAGKVKFGDIDDACPSCGEDALMHVLVSPPCASDEPDYYECIENLLLNQAEQGDEVGVATMVYIERLKDRAGLRGSMGSDNDPSFMSDPGNERWRDTIAIDKDTHPRAVCPYPDGCTGCYDDEVGPPDGHAFSA